MSLEMGKAKLAIVDPTGAVRFQRRIDPASPLELTLWLAGGPGKWVAVLSHIDAPRESVCRVA